MSTEDIIKLAYDLGNAIAKSDEINGVKAMQSRLAEEPETYALIMRYQEAKSQLEAKQRDGMLVTAGEENHINILEQQLNSNAMVGELMKVQEKFDNLMQGVYMAMNEAISGSDCAGGCDSGCCSSCGGSCEM